MGVMQAPRHLLQQFGGVAPFLALLLAALLLASPRSLLLSVWRDAVVFLLLILVLVVKPTVITRPTSYRESVKRLHMTKMYPRDNHNPVIVWFWWKMVSELTMPAHSYQCDSCCTLCLCWKLPGRRGPYFSLSNRFVF